MKYILKLFLFCFVVCVPVGETKAEIISKSSWALLCDNKKQCQVYANIKTDKNIIASSFSLIKATVRNSKEKQIVGVILVPLGLHIPSGVKVTIDNSISFKANLVECKQRGCRALFATSSKLLNFLNKGKKISITIVDSNSRKPVILSYSLTDFTKIYSQFASQ